MCSNSVVGNIGPGDKIYMTTPTNFLGNKNAIPATADYVDTDIKTTLEGYQ